MNVAGDLITAVKKKDYIETVGCIRKACEEVFGYTEKGKCFQDSEISGQYIVPLVEVAPGLTAILVTNIPGLMLGNVQMLSGECRHYGTSSKKEPEGIVYHVLFSKDNLKLVDDTARLPSGLSPVRFTGYGDRWWKEGELREAPDCFQNTLKVPRDVVSVSEVSLDEFVKEIKGK
jgi:hypothetical protein